MKGSGTALVYRSDAAGDAIQRVDQHLGLHAPQGIGGKVGFRFRPFEPRDGRELVRGRGEDQPLQLLQVVAAGNEFLLQVGQQLGVARRVVVADVVRLVDDAASHHPGPGAVDDGLREPRIFRPDQPIGEHLARIAVGRNRGLGAVGEDGRQRPVGAQRFLQRPGNLVRRGHRLGDGIDAGAVLPGTAAEPSGSQKTISSFHSLVGL